MPESKHRKKRRGKRPPPKQVESPRKRGPSPTWYVALMFGLMAVGALIIILNYMGLVPGDTSNVYLVVGLAAIAGGFGMTLNFH